MSHHGHRGFPVTKQMRSERRKRAEEMQAEYDKLTLEQKLAKLPPEPGAKKQRARLLLLIQKKKDAVEAEKLAAAVKKESAAEKASKKVNKDK